MNSATSDLVFIETHTLAYRQIDKRLEEVFGTAYPRYHNRIRAREVPWHSHEGEELRARIKARASLFLQSAGFRREDFTEEAWRSMERWVECGCIDGGLDITESGALIEAPTVIKYHKPNRFSVFGIFQSLDGWDCCTSWQPRLDRLDAEQRQLVIDWGHELLCGASERCSTLEQQCEWKLRALIVNMLWRDLKPILESATITLGTRSLFGDAPPFIRPKPAVFTHGVCHN